MARILSDKMQKYALYIAATAVLGVQLLFLYWVFWPYEPLRIHYIKPIEIVNGEYFTYEMSYKKLMPLPCRIGRQFVDGVTVSLPHTESNLPVGEKTSKHTVVMPKLQKGTYYFKWYATYEVNPLREITVSYKTNTFEIR